VLMNRIGFAGVLLAAVLVAACSDDGGNTGSGGSGGGGGTGGSGGGTGPETISFAVRLADATAMTDKPLEGIEVCAADHPEIACATSDVDGKLTLTLPAESELMLRCENDIFGPMYMTWAIGAEDIDAGTFSLLTKPVLEAFVKLSGGTEWPEKGAIIANVYDDLVVRDERVPGATFTIAPESGGGPVYVSPEKLPDKALTASTEGGPALFFDLDPGEVTITIDHPDRTCVAGFGWAADGDKALRSKIFAGGVSSVTFVCPP
jgi:hypothetical protein